MDFSKLVKSQREYFNLGKTLDIKDRLKKLKLLKIAMENYKDKIFAAIKTDFNKPATESLMTEYFTTLTELKHFIKKLKTWARPKVVPAGLAVMPAKCRVYYEPYGVNLIISPWNYPVFLTICPFIASIAAGNCAVVKPSNYTPNTSRVLKDIIESVFPEEQAAVILGGRNEIAGLLEQKYDYIFFTGSPNVGRLVMESAAKNLTPLTLELGGKSPCIVDCDADIDISAKRTVWGKYLNGGQTCVAPDYVLVHKSVHKQFVEKAKYYTELFYYKNGKVIEDFPFVITEKHTERIMSYIDTDKVVCGGKNSGRLVEPTILDNVTYDDKIMQEEIFGPVMPIIEFDNLDSVIEGLKSKDKPLALYYFSKNSKKAARIINECHFGGGCINDTVLHVSTAMPFGGVGLSGMGSYHGYKSFETFSHPKSILKKGKFALNLIYRPYTKGKHSFMDKLSK